MSSSTPTQQGHRKEIVDELRRQAIDAVNELASFLPGSSHDLPTSSPSESSTQMRWYIHSTERLRALETVSHLTRVHQNLLAIARESHRKLRAESANLQYFSPGNRGFQAFRKTQELLKTEGRLSAAEARTLLNQTILIHAHAPEALDKLVTGELTMARFEVMYKNLRSLEAPNKPGKNASAEEKEQYQDDVTSLEDARSQLGRALLERAIEPTADAESANDDQKFCDEARELKDALHPHSSLQRAKTAAQKRRVSIYETEDGMADLLAKLPAAQLLEFQTKLKARARQIRAAGGANGRTLAMIEADEFLNVLASFATSPLGSAVPAVAETNVAPQAEADKAHDLNTAEGNQLESGSAETESIADEPAVESNGEVVPIPQELINMPAAEATAHESEDAETNQSEVSTAGTEQDSGDSETALTQPETPVVPVPVVPKPAPGRTTNAPPPGSWMLPVVKFNIEDPLKLGVPVRPELYPVLHELNPEYVELAQRNLEHKAYCLAENLEAAPPWLHEDECGYRVDGTDVVLSATEVQALLNSTEFFMTLLMDATHTYPIGYGQTRHQADETMKILIRLRDVTCRAPGCCKRATEAELDHIIDYVRRKGGTNYCNLMYLCRDHHQHKSPGWYNVLPLPSEGDGAVVFINTQTGRRTVTRPRGERLHPVAHTHLREKIREYESTVGSQLAHLATRKTSRTKKPKKPDRFDDTG